MLLLLLLFLVKDGWAACRAGQSYCADLNSALGYPYTRGQTQWATCVTNAYIHQKSKLKYHCPRSSSCIYPCMLEVKNKFSGDVTAPCTCDPSLPKIPLVPQLLPGCYTPSGNECGWFGVCLLKRFPSCVARTNAYAVSFAETFCSMYSHYNSTFTAVSRKWVDAVRRCLMLSMVPLLRSWSNPTCQQIRDNAFSSHTPCYLAPQSGAPSICSLSCTEFLRIFWIMRASYPQLDTAGEALKGLWNAGLNCTCQSDRAKFGQLIKVMRLSVKKSNTRPRRSGESLPESDLQQRFASGVSLAIARSLKWNYWSMDWFSFPDKRTNLSSSDVSNIILTLVDAKSLNLRHSAKKPDFSKTIHHLALTISTGNLPLRVDGAYAWVKSLELCQNTSCSNTKILAVSDSHPAAWPAVEPHSRPLARCNPSSGPAGQTRCVDLGSRYTPGHYQWATCLTNTYIKQKSSHRHKCINEDSKYCWYQCMIEVHHRDRGEVYDDCSCNPRYHSPNHKEVPRKVLPSSCSSPSGNDCGWFQNCLQKKYPLCVDTTNAYALDYGKKLCKLFHSSKSKFTSKGQKWIDSAGKCLQVSLAPLMRTWNNPTCQQIRKSAFDSHKPCYLRPDLRAPSVCSLTCTEYLRIFWFIVGSYSALDTAGETLKGLWNVGVPCTCALGPSNEYEHQLIKVARITVRKFLTRPKRFADFIPESDLRQRFAASVSSDIARSLGWKRFAMDWFGFYDNKTITSNSSVSTFNLILVDTKWLGMGRRWWDSQVNLNETIHQFAAAVTEESLPLRADGAYVWVKSLQLCHDIFCNSTETVAVSDNPPIWPTEPPTVELPTNLNVEREESNQKGKKPHSAGANLRHSLVLVVILVIFVLHVI